MLDSKLLDAYIDGSWGYGNPGGDLWFVGMEQGGGTSFEEIQRRLAAWDKAGRAAFDDIHEYCLAIGELRWTGPNPRIQPTWKHLIRIVLAAHGAAHPRRSGGTRSTRSAGAPAPRACWSSRSSLAAVALGLLDSRRWVDRLPRPETTVATVESLVTQLVKWRCKEQQGALERARRPSRPCRSPTWRQVDSKAGRS